MLLMATMELKWQLPAAPNIRGAHLAEAGPSRVYTLPTVPQRHSVCGWQACARPVKVEQRLGQGAANNI